MTFWESWSGVFAAVAALGTLLSAWFFQAPLIQIGRAIWFCCRRDENRSTSSEANDSYESLDPTLKELKNLTKGLKDLRKDIRMEMTLQTQLLKRISDMMESRLPPQGDEWVAEVRLRRPGFADLGGQPQSQNDNSDVASG
ncbi:hypothetical protein C2857_000352 [Epichloe festucae Fl1]|uniref:Uncharacterized protein n=1 Tax=Epichloe festucae (strain Fl1) TaxID=877507 RepID=A0A7S9KU15_EPIFF|nr:hypothetical protein C2857_000352 [Epichloe festucae Fl1]